MSKKWTLAGVPMTPEQIKAIKQARKNGDRRVYTETTPEQSVALKKRAVEADAELQEMLAEMRDAAPYAKAIRSRRHELGMTLDELAEATGISKANLSRLEWGKATNPTLDTLKRVGEGLGLVLTVDYSAA